MYVSSLERQTEQLKRYGLTTALLSFLLSGAALGCLVYAFVNYEEVKQIQYIVSNWHTLPVYDIKAVKTNETCPAQYDPMLTTEWPGTYEVCLCYPESGKQETTRGACPDDAGDNCQTVPGTDPIQMQIVYNQRYCIKRGDRPINYAELPPVNTTTNQCPDEYHYCGDETQVCWPNDLVCPINEIMLIGRDRTLQGNETDPASNSTSSQSTPSNSTSEATPTNSTSSSTNSTTPASSSNSTDSSQSSTDSTSSSTDESQSSESNTNSTDTSEGSSKTVDPNQKINIRFEFNSVLDIVATNQGPNNPLVEFSWGYSQMCLEPSYYSNEKYDSATNKTTLRTDIFNLTRKQKLGCPHTDVGQFDNRWDSIVTYAESGVYTQNGIFDALETVPTFDYEDTPNDMTQPMHSVFARGYIEWKAECISDPLRSPHRLQEERNSMEQIHEQLLILTIIAGVVFAVVGLFYPLVTWCCQCCGPTTLNSYKLFLASKGVASFLLVGGFSVVLGVFIQKPYKFNSNFRDSDCSDPLTNRLIWESDGSVDHAFAFEALSFISLGVLLMIEMVMAGYYCCLKDYK